MNCPSRAARASNDCSHARYDSRPFRRNRHRLHRALSTFTPINTSAGPGSTDLVQWAD
jgi:hypothetical protein